MSYDARVRYTKTAIRDSIIRLLEEKPFHKLTLTQVCQKAGINRTTFYRYYRDLYDWRSQMERECLERTVRILQTGGPGGMEDVLTRQFRDMKENRGLYGLFFSPQFESSALEQAVLLALENTHRRVNTGKSPATGGEDRKKWASWYITYGGLGLVIGWIQNGMKEDPRELAHWVVQLGERTLHP